MERRIQQVDVRENDDQQHDCQGTEQNHPRRGTDLSEGHDKKRYRLAAGTVNSGSQRAPSRGESNAQNWKSKVAAPLVPR